MRYKIKKQKLRYVRNKNKYRMFNNENCLRLTFKVLSRAFFNIGKKLNLIFQRQELFIFATAYQTHTLPKYLVLASG